MKYNNHRTKLFEKNKISSIEELVSPFLEMKISSYLYMKSVMPNNCFYHIHNNLKWEKIVDKEDAILKIENKYSSEKGSFYYFFKKQVENKNSLINRYLGSIQKFLLKIYLKNKNHLFILTDKERYFFSELTYFLRYKKHKN